MIGRSKELEDVGRVASSFPTYLGKIEATLLAGYPSGGTAKYYGCFLRPSLTLNIVKLILEINTILLYHQEYSIIVFY